MTQIQGTKLNQSVAIGPSGMVSVPKLVMSVLLIPGTDSGDDGQVRQAHVYSQIIRRR